MTTALLILTCVLAGTCVVLWLGNHNLIKANRNMEQTIRTLRRQLYRH